MVPSSTAPPVPPPQKQGPTAGQTTPAQAPPVAVIAPTPAKPVNIQAIEASQERIIVVESPLYRVELSNRGGVVRSWKLKSYSDDQKPPHPLELVNADSSQQLGWPFSLLLFDEHLESQANSGLYDVTPGSDHFQSPVEITFRWSDAHLSVVKTLKFGSGYEMSVETAVLMDGKPLPVGSLRGAAGSATELFTKASQLVNVFYKQNGKLNLLQYKKLGYIR